MSPLTNSDAESFVSVSQNDHLIQIIKSLGVKKDEALRVGSSVNYIEQIYSSNDCSGGDRLQRLLNGVDPSLFELIDKLLKFDPVERSSLTDLLELPLFKGIRQASSENPSSSKLYLNLDRLKMNKEGEFADYSSTKLRKHLVKLGGVMKNN
jgi:serine/threonine protein kinase